MSQDEQNENFQTSETHNLSFKAPTELTEGDFSHSSQSMEISISKQNEQNESQTEGTLNERKRQLEPEIDFTSDNIETSAKQSKLDLTEQNDFKVESDDIDDIENISSGLKLLNMYL